ncbi:ethylbenzene dehydrogenase [Siculibacillus lacustris]|uniref:Ethylbenzene dehydrogenase n=1 Tax=Siculibacillus lacustris TaxID=1549641 RepID=A0A4Q9VFS0_9HYPH|nr:ethylbenzene dehydrogenase-related protein [Siculibacillus lacustris]TBW33793.1 ethylbenzene dehydrogenase [Siculibacillus lacustris]
MRRLFATVALTLPVCLYASGAFAEEEKRVPLKPIDVHAVKVAAAPVLDAAVVDGVWKTAPATEVKAQKGINFKDGQGNTTGTIQAAYDAKTIWLRVVYDDPTLSVRRMPYVKQADGSWKKLVDPDDKGGDNNKYYEDKTALIWNIDHSIFGFDEKFGCQASCHAGEPGKPYGNKYTEDEGELGDIWHMKYVRGGFNGQADNQYLDSTRFDAAKFPDAGRKSDASAAGNPGGYADIKLVEGKPEFMSKDAKPANKGGTYWLKAEDKVAFDDSKFVPGDEVSSILVAPFTGDRGVIKVSAKWAEGKWTIVFERPLTTASKFDVQFADLSKVYGFGIAFFDNAQVRHAQVREPLHLIFDK